MFKECHGSCHARLTIPQSPACDIEPESSTNLDHLSTHDYSKSYILSPPECHNSSGPNLYCSTPLNESLQSSLLSLSKDISWTDYLIPYQQFP